MCGIVGVFDPADPPDADVIRAMSECLAHRGPDDDGFHLEGPVGIGHTRLSIIDLETGSQPIYNEDGSVAVVFNGEIYNYRSLRRSLKEEGHRFETDTDTEVLAHLYEEEGPDLVERLDGMYAFAIWDAQETRLVLARDPIGIKPLVTVEADGRFGFASEIPAILAGDIPHGGLDEEGLAAFFAFGYIPAPQTAFENISKLRPGEVLVLTEGGQTRSIRGIPSVAHQAPGFDTAATELRTLVGDAVEARLQSDVPLGAFLSGGIDSSVVVGAMAERAERPVRTFTVGFDEPAYDESSAARAVAAFHDTDHHEFTLTADDVREMVPEVLDRLGEPFADQSLIPTFLVSRATSGEVKVALSGDGGDELFAGYDKYRVEHLSPLYRALPSGLRSRVIEPVVDRLPATRSNRLGRVGYRAQWATSRAGEPSVPDRHFELMRLPDERMGDTYEGIDPVATGREALRRQHAALLSSQSSRDPLTRIRAVDVRYSLPNQMLSKVDLASMYNSLEVRVPLLSKDVVEHALSLPSSYHITLRERKRLLRRAFADLLPDSILSRSKQGFDMPIGAWFRGELAGEFERTVREVETGLLDTRAVLDAFEAHRRGRREHSKFLWSVYVYKRWARRLTQRGILDL